MKLHPLSLPRFVSMAFLLTCGTSSYGATLWDYDFGTPTGVWNTNAASTTFLPAPEAGGGTARVRVGSGGGSFSLTNPGTGSFLVGVAPTSGSVNKFSIYDFADATPTISLSFDLTLSGGASGTWSLFLGNGTTFSDSNAFTGTETFAGLRMQFGASGAITVNNRSGGSWANIAGTGIVQNTKFSISIIGNNSASSISYGDQTLAANSWDLWVNNMLVASDLSKAQLTTASAIDSFMFYGESSASNVATISLDNISYANYAVPEPSSALLGSLAALGLLRRRRDSRS